MIFISTLDILNDIPTTFNHHTNRTGDTMHRGILSPTTAPQVMLSPQEDIAGELAYDEAVELATESEHMLENLQQANAVKEVLDEKRELLLNGECAPVLALECMNMSLLALGGKPVPVLSTESDMGTLATEGIGSVINKIVESTKLILKRVLNSLKVIVTKLLVAMDRTGKKAESLYKSFNADKQAYPKQGKIDEDKAEKIVRKSQGLRFIREQKYSQSKFEANIKAGFAYSERLGDDMNDFHKKSGGSTVPARLMEVFKSMTPTSIKIRIAKAVASNPTGFRSDMGAIARLAPGTPYQMTEAQKESAQLPGSTDDGFVFLPVYVKGNRVHGTVIYVADPEPDPEDVFAIINAISYGTGSFEYTTDDKISELAAKERVMDKGSINAELSSLKSSSTKLKALATTRINYVNKIMGEISKMSSKDGGNMKFSKVATSDITKRKAISSITAYAAMNKNRLSYVAAHIDLYE